MAPTTQDPKQIQSRKSYYNNSKNDMFLDLYYILN